MLSRLLPATSLLAILATLSQAYPGPEAAPAPQITPPPTLVRREPSKTWKYRRDLLDDIGDGVDEVFSFIGSDVPSYVASGVPNFFQDFPTGDDVQSSLGIDYDQLQALPTQVLNIPPYGNWTDDGWYVRFRGNVYKQPNTSIETLDDLANVFLIGVDMEDLSPSQQDQARNLTASILVVQQEDENVTMELSPAHVNGASGEPNGGGGASAGSGTNNITLLYPTTELGDFDVFMPIGNLSSGGIAAGNATDDVQKINIHAQGATLGNATAYLVPPQGITIVSDVDDILRVTKIYQPDEGLLNTFARPFTPWMNMPEIYAEWSRSMENSTHFHYLTTTPEQVTRPYMEFIYDMYPGGSFDTRPLNFSDIDQTLSVRKSLLTRIFETFPERRFVLVADTSNSDVMSAYPEMATTFPGQVACIFLRNTSATDEDNLFPYDTSGFEDLDSSTYMFFRVPDDLRGLDIANGECVNNSIPQNVTFQTQAELLGIHGAASTASVSMTVWAAVVAAALWAFI